MEKLHSKWKKVILFWHTIFLNIIYFLNDSIDSTCSRINSVELSKLSEASAEEVLRMSELFQHVMKTLFYAQILTLVSKVHIWNPYVHLLSLMAFEILL